MTNERKPRNEDKGKPDEPETLDSGGTGNPPPPPSPPPPTPPEFGG